MIGKLIALILIGLVIFLAFHFGNMRYEEIDSGELKEVTVIAQVVNSPYSKYSYTECVFDYNGERHITNFRPCTAFVGEKLTVLVTSEGRVLDYSIQYKK